MYHMIKVGIYVISKYFIPANVVLGIWNESIQKRIFARASIVYADILFFISFIRSCRWVLGRRKGEKVRGACTMRSSDECSVIMHTYMWEIEE